MRIDTVQNSGSATLPSITGNVPKPRKKWLSDADDVFDYLERYELEKDGWWRSMSATLSLLKYTNALLMRAEKKVTQQQQTISRLEDASLTDTLTGLKNKHGFYEYFLKEVDRTNRGLSVGGILILIDLDNFKAIDKKHGEFASSKAVKILGEALKTQIRTMDVAARIADDEFILMFANARREDILERAQNLIRLLNRLTLEWNTHNIPLRISLGIKDYKQGDTAEKIFKI